MRWPAKSLLLVACAGAYAAWASAEKPRLPSRSITLKWEKVPESIRYELEITRLSGGQRSAPEIFSAEGTKWTHTFEVGTYEMRMRSVDDRDVAGEWGEPARIVAKLPATEVASPESGAEIKPAPRAPTQRVRIAWAAKAGAVRYRAKLLDDNDQVIDERDLAELGYEIIIPAGASYTLKVAALDADGTVGDFAKSSFKVLSSFEKIRFLSGEYYFGKYAYDGHNRELASIVRGDAAVSGFWFGLDYRPEGLFDYGAKLDLASFRFGALSTSLLKAEFHANYRIEAWGGDAQYYVSSGLRYEDIPELLAVPNGGPMALEKISGFGPFLGLKRASALTERLSLNLAGQVGMSLLGIGTPNGEGMSSAFRLGAEASLGYRIRENFFGKIGVAYDLKKGAYRAKEYQGGTENNFSSPGDKNEVNLSGGKIGLGIGWGF